MGEILARLHAFDRAAKTAEVHWNAAHRADWRNEEPGKIALTLLQEASTAALVDFAPPIISDSVAEVLRGQLEQIHRLSEMTFYMNAEADEDLKQFWADGDMMFAKAKDFSQLVKEALATPPARGD